MTLAATQSHAPCLWGNCSNQRLHEYTAQEPVQHTARVSAGTPAAASNRARVVEVSDALLRTPHRAPTQYRSCLVIAFKADERRVGRGLSERHSRRWPAHRFELDSTFSSGYPILEHVSFCRTFPLRVLPGKILPQPFARRLSLRNRMSGNPRDLQDIHAMWPEVPHYSTCTDPFFHVGQYLVERYVPGHTNSGWTVMGNPTQPRDMQLVRDCLSGSEQAWNEFYSRYVGLVRSMVRRQLGWGGWSVDDMTQSVFAALIPALNHYDAAYSLSRFVCVIAERVCIQEYRQSKAAKRDGQTEPIDHHDSGEEGIRNVASDSVSQEQLLADSQTKAVLRRALERLGSGCRRLLALRYFEELPYKEISNILGASENTLTVKARRCLAELTAHFDEISRGGGTT